MTTYLYVAIGLLLVVISSLMIVPKYMYAFFDTIIGKIFLFLVLVFMSSNNVLLGLLFAVIIILISKEFNTNSFLLPENSPIIPENLIKQYGPIINVNQRIKEKRPKSSKVFMNMYSKNSENALPSDKIHTYAPI